MGRLGRQFVLTESREWPKESTSSCQIKQRWTMWSPAETRYCDIPWHTMTYYDILWLCWTVPKLSLVPSFVGFPGFPVLIPPRRHMVTMWCVISSTCNRWRKIRNLWKWQGSWVIKPRPTGIYGGYVELNWVIRLYTNLQLGGQFVI